MWNECIKNATSGKRILLRKITAGGLKLCLHLWHSFRIKWDYACETYISMDKILVHTNSNVSCTTIPVLILWQDVSYCIIILTYLMSSTLNARVGITSYFVLYPIVKLTLWRLTYDGHSISFCWWQTLNKL